MAEDVAAAVREIFALMPAQLNTDVARGMNSVIQVVLSGDGGGQWCVSIVDGACSVSEGPAESANMTMSMSAADYVDMVIGKLSGEMALVGGKLKISGDPGVAIKMRSLFLRPA